jgi:hypothetical protein
VTTADPPRGPVTPSGVQRLLDAYDELMRRAGVLEEIADRLAATCTDPVAVADYRTWKSG